MPSIYQILLNFCIQGLVHSGPCKNDPKISPLNVIQQPFPSEGRLFPHPCVLVASSGFNSPVRVYICCIWGANTTCAEARASLLGRRLGGAPRLAGQETDLSASPSWVIWMSSDPRYAARPEDISWAAQTRVIWPQKHKLNIKLF